jgi:hypothetical protein
MFGVLNPLNGVLQFRQCIDNGIRWRDRGLRDILVLEKHRVCQSFHPCLLAKNHVHSVMFRGRFQIKSIARMLTKRLSSAWFYMELDRTSHGRKWHAIIIETAVMIRPCRDVGSHI